MPGYRYLWSESVPTTRWHGMTTGRGLTAFARQTAIGPIDPREYLPRNASALGLLADIERAAHDFAQRSMEDGIAMGLNPGGVAAARLYAAAVSNEYPLTQSEAAAVAGVIPVTARSSVAALTG